MIAITTSNSTSVNADRESFMRRVVRRGWDCTLSKGSIPKGWNVKSLLGRVFGYGTWPRIPDASFSAGRPKEPWLPYFNRPASRRGNREPQAIDRNPFLVMIWGEI
jgi:hypothetical protein